jgi:hypothetical protein
MKSFLILGEPADVHGQYVSWALGRAGYRTRFINSSHENCPTCTTLYLDKETDGFSSIEWNGAEAVWCRRPPVSAPFGLSDDADEAFRMVEECRFTRWVIDLQRADAATRWINPLDAALRAENKLIQLKRARSCGMEVPRTLVTTDPRRFRAFLRAEGTVVAKPLSGYTWNYESGETLTAFASLIDARIGAELSDSDIERCVTFYQQRIEKVADIRMVIMGEDMFAYKITQNGLQHFDFRIGFYQENHLHYEPIALPRNLGKQVTEFMTSLDINFASADFALTPDGEFVFLDLNPNGQWLFIEEAFPEARIGQKFCSFFVSGKVNPAEERCFPSYRAFTESDVGKRLEGEFREYHARQERPTNSWRQRRA